MFLSMHLRFSLLLYSIRKKSKKKNSSILYCISSNHFWFIFWFWLLFLSAIPLYFITFLPAPQFLFAEFLSASHTCMSEYVHMYISKCIYDCKHFGLFVCIYRVKLALFCASMNNLIADALDRHTGNIFMCVCHIVIYH